MPREWWKRSQSAGAASGTVGAAKADLIVPLNAESWAEAKADRLTPQKNAFKLWTISEKRFTWNVLPLHSASVFLFNLK